MNMSKENVLFIMGMISLAIGGMAFLYWILEGKDGPPEWQKFVRDHNCVQVAEIESITTFKQGITVGPDGAMHPSFILLQSPALVHILATTA